MLLLETIADVRKLYPQITDQDFNRLIRLDPTFNPNRDSVGTYGKWILTLFKKHKLNNEGHVTDLLRRFDEVKSQLKEKDINRFKSLEEVDNYLDNQDNYNALTARQQLRKTQTAVQKTDITKDAEKVYEDSSYEVWVPHTYEASCKLGQGTSWCTATTNSDYYYNYYSKQGPLYIIIEKGYPEIKYQFHFPSNQFMNADDESIEPFSELFDLNPNLAEFFRPLLLQSWDLDPDIHFEEDISITLNDNDFYDIFDSLSSESSRSIKGPHIYAILYSPLDFYEDGYYNLDEDEFDNLINFYLTSDTKEAFIEALGEPLTYDNLIDTPIFEELESIYRQLHLEADINKDQDYIMSKISEVFQNDNVITNWSTDKAGEYIFTITGPLEELIRFKIYEDPYLTAPFANSLTYWVACKIFSELSIPHAPLETYALIDTEKLNDQILSLLQ